MKHKTNKYIFTMRIYRETMRGFRRNKKQRMGNAIKHSIARMMLSTYFSMVDALIFLLDDGHLIRK